MAVRIGPKGGRSRLGRPGRPYGWPVPSKIIEVAEEWSPKKVFVWALEWPGWCRSGRDPQSALDALALAAGRYAGAARRAGVAFPIDGAEFVTVTRVEGDGGTAFGVPSVITDYDRRPVRAAEARKIAALIASSWAIFDEVAANAPENLRKGPRGGGRDTSRVVTHVEEADHAYAREIGLKVKPPHDRETVEGTRKATVDALGRPSDGSPLGGRKWPQRYAARRIAWHALDHAWEIEDRTPEAAKNRAHPFG